MQLRDRTAGFVRSEGGLLPADLLERIRTLDRKLPGLDETSYGLGSGERFGEAITRSWNRLAGGWVTFSDEMANLLPNDPATTPTRERWLLPLMEELGYGRLSPVKAVEIDGKSYPVSHAVDTIPLHLVGANVPLDRRSKGVAGAAGQSPHGLLQEFLNRSPDRLWGLVSNGRILRILRDNASLTRQAYVEFDLEAIFSGEAYTDFALLWHLAHRTRLEARVSAGPEQGAALTAHGAYLERWSKVAEETGARARDRLRDGVQEAIEALGSGFLAHPANGLLRTALQGGELTTQDYYRELLRLVYRLILLFVAEDRDLLLDPKTDGKTRERYTRYYSTGRLRRLAGRRKGSRHADLYAGLRVVIAALSSEEGATGIGLPPLGGFLFGPDGCPHLDRAELANGDLLDAVRKLATIEERSVLRTVDYRNLGSEELGSIYESLLELHPELDVVAPSFALRTAAGHERKTTGSYYTPSSLISVLLDSALDPVLAKAADKPTMEEAERAILELSVVDPAAGSGHFLVAAAHRIAKRLAQVRTEDEEPAPEAVTTALRDVIGHCLYAVDINPMAVELCKVSLWLEALEPGRPLTFLDAHIKCGNSLLGTSPELIAQGIPDAAYTPIEGDDKAVAAALKKRNRAEREGQLSLGEAGLEVPLSELADAASAIDAQRDDDVRALETKRRNYADLLTSPGFTRPKLIADAWCAAALQAKTSGTSSITTGMIRRLAANQSIGLPEGAKIAELAATHRLFHWHIEFPDVFKPQTSDQQAGFDAVIGNPPFVNAIEGGVSQRESRFVRMIHSSLGSTADLAYFFLAEATQLVSGAGRIGLIQPRAVLNAGSLQHFRAAPPRGFSPSLIYAPNNAGFFPGASVFVAVLGLARDGIARISTDSDPFNANWRATAVIGDNWWLALTPDASAWAVEPTRARIADQFEVYASMFVQEAYEAAQHVVDDSQARGPKLITTGLIDPGVSLWGKTPCRYLKKTYTHPRLVVGNGTSRALQTKLARSLRPKILVAGLAKRIECFVDAAGEYIGVVSTYTILDPNDDVGRLEELCQWLLTEPLSTRFRAELGGNAMGGGNTTMRREFLASLPLPA